MIIIIPNIYPRCLTGRSHGHHPCHSTELAPFQANESTQVGQMRWKPLVTSSCFFYSRTNAYNLMDMRQRLYTSDLRKVVAYMHIFAPQEVMTQACSWSSKPLSLSNVGHLVAPKRRLIFGGTTQIDPEMSSMGVMRL